MPQLVADFIHGYAVIRYEERGERDETKSTNNDNDTTYRLQQVNEVETDEPIPITFGGIIVNDWDEIRVDIE